MRGGRMTERTVRRQQQIVAPRQVVGPPADYVKSFYKKSNYSIDYNKKSSSKLCAVI
jgi:hypothetical protein